MKSSGLLWLIWQDLKVEQVMFDRNGITKPFLIFYHVRWSPNQIGLRMSLEFIALLFPITYSDRSNLSYHSTKMEQTLDRSCILADVLLFMISQEFSKIHWKKIFRRMVTILKVSNFRMNLWCHRFSKKTNKFF